MRAVGCYVAGEFRNPWRVVITNARRGCCVSGGKHGETERSGSPDRRTRWAAPPRTAYTSETKPFFLTSEFLAFVLLLMGLGIGTAVSSDVDPRLFGSSRLLQPGFTCSAAVSRSPAVAAAHTTHVRTLTSAGMTNSSGASESCWP